VLFSTRVRFRVMVRVRIRLGVWLVSGYAHVFILLCAVIVTLQLTTCRKKTHCTVSDDSPIDNRFYSGRGGGAERGGRRGVAVADD